ncbi:MerR family transcriptional regulator [Halomonas elongata]|uniref:MerR family DNA-binding protein n=2 Tax=Halomonas elongata TaxID=2746 RepID=E1V964_HALED|nr:MerR family transcriptional regulator [Halomonas elongata]MBW5799184.1 MerR family DNA-binding protein [Halomonas elongata]OBX34619.1 HTH-type transcriptional regulator ZntR [Halomonas elongata]RAW08412.1 MerR family transcriptional regulator [Halomonas elongata]WBF17476.1 MerR family DNA-binding protein [Halomonas elongata]WPU46315.1 MerR family DNA-binding protein [Halomonas elongata DSM 2581]
MKVIDLARRAGVTAETVRHYTREGLLAPERDPDNGYQRYDSTDLERLRFIQRARTLGFSVAEIRQILEHADHGDSPCPLVRDLMAERLPEIRARIRELEALASRMEQALEAWSDMPDGTPDGHSLCRLIESFPEALATADDTTTPRQEASS